MFSGGNPIPLVVFQRCFFFLPGPNEVQKGWQPRGALDTRDAAGFWLGLGFSQIYGVMPTGKKGITN